MLTWQLKPQHHWIGMIVLGVFFTLGAIAMLIGSFFIADTFQRWAVFVVALLVLVVGVVPLVKAPQARRETALTAPDDLVPARPDPGPARDGRDLVGERWPLPAVASALAHELEGTPYVVEHYDRVIRVRWELGNQSWWVLAQKNGIDRVFETRLTRARDGRLSRTDLWHALDWQAGVPVVGAVDTSTTGGRVWRYERRKEWGTDREGLTTKVDYTFNTADLDRPLEAVLERAGWQQQWGAEARGAVVVGLIGASAIILVPAALLLQWWLDR